MDLPRYHLPEEDEDVDMDATAPAQFVLKLPKSFARRFAPPPPAPMLFTPSAPWTVDRVEPTEESPRVSRERAALVAIVASVLVGVMLIASVATVSASAHGPIGIAHRAPKSLDTHVRSAERRTGVASRVHARTVSIESLARPRHRSHRARR